jgi:hypothetical protein
LCRRSHVRLILLSQAPPRTGKNEARHQNGDAFSSSLVAKVLASHLTIGARRELHCTIAALHLTPCTTAMYCSRLCNAGLIRGRSHGLQSCVLPFQRSMQSKPVALHLNLLHVQCAKRCKKIASATTVAGRLPEIWSSCYGSPPDLVQGGTHEQAKDRRANPTPLA